MEYSEHDTEEFIGVYSESDSESEAEDEPDVIDILNDVVKNVYFHLVRHFPGSGYVNYLPTCGLDRTYVNILVMEIGELCVKDSDWKMSINNRNDELQVNIHQEFLEYAENTSMNGEMFFKCFDDAVSVHREHFYYIINGNLKKNNRFEFIISLMTQIHCDLLEWGVVKTGGSCNYFFRRNILDWIKYRVEKIFMTREENYMSLCFAKYDRKLYAEKLYEKTNNCVIKIQSIIRGHNLRWRYPLLHIL